MFRGAYLRRRQKRPTGRQGRRKCNHIEFFRKRWLVGTKFHPCSSFLNLLMLQHCISRIVYREQKQEKNECSSNAHIGIYAMRSFSEATNKTLCNWTRCLQFSVHSFNNFVQCLCLCSTKVKTLFWHNVFCLSTTRLTSYAEIQTTNWVDISTRCVRSDVKMTRKM